MELTNGEIMLIGGIAAFVILLLALIIMLKRFEISRRRLSEKIREDIEE